MKLPKGFGGQGLGGMMQKMESAMARAKNLDDEMAQEMITVNKGPVTVVVNGLGEVQSVKITDKDAVDLDDLSMLEDMIVSGAKDGFQKALEMKNEKVAEILPDMPNIPGLT